MPWCEREHAVNVRRDRPHVFRREPGCRNTVLVRTSEHRLDLLTIPIVEDDRRSKKVWPTALAASQIGTVTTPALRVVPRSSARNESRVRRITLLRRKTRHPSPPLRPEDDRKER